MGRQRTPKQKKRRNPQKQELHEIEASNLSDIEFKVKVVRMLKELRITRNLVGTTFFCIKTSQQSYRQLFLFYRWDN